MTQIDPLMPIGMFSRASLVSIKALRSYHENGLLVPASIDAATGYRSYRVSQLADAQIIRRLRDLDMPLRDIAEIMSARDPEVTRKIIAGHQAAMVERLEQVGRIVDELYAAAALPAIATPVHIRQQPEGHALAITGEVIEGDYATFLGDAFGRLWGALIAEGLAMVGPSAAMYPAEVRGDREEVIAFLPIGEPVQLGRAAAGAGITLAVLPEVTAAVMTHVGSFDTIGDTYRQLGAWVATNATSLEAPIREHYVVSVDEATGQLLPDDELRTEIVWPIVPGSASQ